MTALDQGAYARALRAFGQSVWAEAILVISAHWQEPGIRITSAARPQLIYDFTGFPRELYELEYPAPGAPDLAAEAAAVLAKTGFKAALDGERGWDHGVWVPLRLMFPAARIPVVQISLPMGWRPEQLYRVGEALRELRPRGVLILGSGGLVHNLALLNWAGQDAPVEPWAVEFQNWVAGKLEQGDYDSLFDYAKLAPHARRAVPTPEHFVPLFPVLGAASSNARPGPIFDGIEYGSMSMYSFKLSS